MTEKEELIIQLFKYIENSLSVIADEIPVPGLKMVDIQTREYKDLKKKLIPLRTNIQMNI